MSEVNGNGNGNHGDTGRSVEDMVNDPDFEADDGQRTLLPIGDAISLKVGGSKPTSSEIKIRSVPVLASGQIGHKADDESYAFLVVARLDKVEFTNKRDDSGKVRDKKRTQVLRPMSVRTLSDDQLARIEAILEEEPLAV